MKLALAVQKMEQTAEALEKEVKAREEDHELLRTVSIDLGHLKEKVTKIEEKQEEETKEVRMKRWQVWMLLLAALLSFAANLWFFFRSEKAAKAREERSGHMTRSVLVLEDDPGVRAMLATALTLDGYRVSEAASAEAARMVFSSGHYDCLVVDHLLPGMHGLDFVRDVVRPEDPRVGIVVITAADRDMVDDLCDGLRIWTVLPKPVSLEDFLSAVEDACEIAEMEPEVADRLFEAIGRETEHLQRSMENSPDDTKIIPPAAPAGA